MDTTCTHVTDANGQPVGDVKQCEYPLDHRYTLHVGGNQFAKTSIVDCLGQFKLRDNEGKLVSRSSYLGSRGDNRHKLCFHPDHLRDANSKLETPIAVEATGSWSEVLLHHAPALIVRYKSGPAMLKGGARAHHYTIEDEHGRPVAYLAEEQPTFQWRHRFVLYDLEDRVLLKMQRPYSVSTMRTHVTDGKDQPIGKVRQCWHLWRRHYKLYVGEKQFAKIKGIGFLWKFKVHDNEHRLVSRIEYLGARSISEAFSSTFRCKLHFHPDYLRKTAGKSKAPIGHPLSAYERLIVLASFINIDVDLRELRHKRI
ncbi:hypothetical protein THASP1DRAFT_31021 [Thamnocephalis sphaerospora]|uniref:Phospholipid scramblase n=1 Tax=Thamnocephalis sphaerospora TaxID=78915 RepID=A0A4P9XPI2_9FUNG|nr:hypothetical protein THASP1DRAFT_31021 [Thamnocephalis sphaerospora]|eukprot:RKP07170.1 hypothetical protein THASP1DRAFT_31021 [Thamnocephalis sphaerospora]